MGYFKLFLEQLKYSWVKKFSLQLTTLLVLTGSFLAVTITTLIVANTNQLFSEIAESFQVSVYLTDQGEQPEQKSKIKSMINSSKIFSEVTFMSKTQALAKFKENMQEQMPSFVIEENEVNPLPSSFALKIKSLHNNEAGFEKVSQFAEGMLSVLGIEDVSYGKSWVNQYSSFLSAYNFGSATLIIFLILSILLVVGNSIKSSISQRRVEIEVLELVGATRLYIRLPFILEGAFMGLVSSAIAILITYGLYKSLISFTASADSEFLFSNLSIEFLPMIYVASICVLSTLIGAVGATICIGRMNTGWAAISE